MTIRHWLLAIGSVSSFAACGTGAQGVTECREIETARCSAAIHCGFPDDEGCQRYTHNNCLHGIAAPEVEPLAVSECREAIEAASLCAQMQGPDTLTDDCDSPIESVSPAAPTACGLIVRPELASACAFLLEEAAEAEEPEPAAEQSEVTEDAGI